MGYKVPCESIIIGRVLVKFVCFSKILEESMKMAATPSNMRALGTPAPQFVLPDTRSGRSVSLNDFAGKPLLVMFICNHCPFVIHVREQLAQIGREYGQKEVGIVAINSNDVASYPEDSPKKMKEVAQIAGFSFPYVFDETQEVARAFDAACTPDFYVYDRAHNLVYRGQLDASRPGNGIPVTGRDLRGALDAVCAGVPVEGVQLPSIGCNIKWKADEAQG